MKNQGAEKVCTYNYAHMWKSKVQEKSVHIGYLYIVDREREREFGIDRNP